MQLPKPLLEQLDSYYRGFWEALPQIFLALVFLILTWLAVHAVRFGISRIFSTGRLRRSLGEVLQMIASVGLWFAGTLIAVTIAFPTVTPGKALTALGLGSVAIGFAFKDIFENFVAGIMLLLREPFRLDDFIECDGIEGQVKRISVRETKIRKTDGQMVIVPNAMLLKQPVHVLTNTDLRRSTIICGVAYGEIVDDALDVIFVAVWKVDSVRNDIRDVEIFAHAFNDSSVDFEVTWWTGSKPIDIRRSRDQVIAAVKRALDDAGVEIPFPYRTLTFNGDVPIRGPSHNESANASNTIQPA